MNLRKTRHKPRSPAEKNPWQRLRLLRLDMLACKGLLNPSFENRPRWCGMDAARFENIIALILH